MSQQQVQTSVPYPIQFRMSLLNQDDEGYWIGKLVMSAEGATQTMKITTTCRNREEAKRQLMKVMEATQNKVNERLGMDAPPADFKESLLH